MTNKQTNQISIGSTQGTGKKSYIEDLIKSYFPESSPVYKKVSKIPFGYSESRTGIIGSGMSYIALRQFNRDIQNSGKVTVIDIQSL